MICLKCQNCLQIEDGPIDAKPPHNVSLHHPTYQSLEQSIDAGCYICSRFWEALSAQERELLAGTLGEGVELLDGGCAVELAKDRLTSTSLEGGKSYGHPGCYLPAVAYATAPTAISTTACWKASFLLEPVDSASPSLARQSLAQSTCSPETLSLARHWVKECTTHHERCKRLVGEKTWYPTRLLSFDLHEASMARLLETDQTTPIGQYMTLTHRWGPVDHMTLTHATYPQLLEGVLLSTLPQVFQDAISICRHLGIGYIWIDSLCIFQGKNHITDWQHEVSLMGNVYSNSFCNISAADSPDCSQSIFSRRDPGRICPQVVEIALRGRDSAKTMERFTLSDYRFWESEVSNALVNKRAWVLQERFLAPRILHFGRRQLIWECCEKDAAEIYPDGLPLSLSTSWDTRFKQLNSSDYISRVGRYRHRETDGLSAPHLLWFRIVGLYTASALTVPSDKLIACSGIVKRMAEIVQDDYVAGMWRRYLEGELLWSVPGNHQPERWTRPKEYRAPSWSWASIDGPVTPGEPRIQDSLITIEDYHLDYLTSDETGPIRGGWLRLRGVLKKTTLGRKNHTSGGGYHWDMVLDGENFNALEEVSPGYSNPLVMLDILQEDFEEENAKGLLFYMCARSNIAKREGMYILMLKMVEEEKGTFQRIGLAYAWSKEVKERILMRGPGEAQLPCLEYHDGLHSICII
ncbi:heterokaryon incompatibility protein-domain-containing protein [Ilyonectria sp. MPI-CAGE-AT-0026]|nr:heterokaryon incompatibility protein-domain-containing protein [Ilyonectria sp. MPI-CAGE-AT-0026]